MMLKLLLQLIRPQCYVEFPPKHIRYLRLNGLRTTMIRMICLPDESDDAHKFVQEAIQAFPEIYFSRLVVLGEGDSEEIVLPRIFKC